MADPARFTDAQLVAAYLATEGEPGDEWVEALIAGMTNREFDF